MGGAPRLGWLARGGDNVKRIVFFDIDGTLILTERAGQHAMNTIAHRPLDLKDASAESRFAGRTDRAIILDYLRSAGIPETEENVAQFAASFLARLPGELRERRGRVLPGVVEMLERLSGIPDVIVALLTGNLRSAARMKLDHYLLTDYFYANGEALGGFGDEHPDRDDVARQALASVQAAIGTDEPLTTWVIGDTPNDIRCARAISANVLAVATGSYSRTELLAWDPDLVVDDLASADDWWNWFSR